MKEVLKHFSTHDPVIYAVLVEHQFAGLHPKLKSDQFFLKLCQDIISQQLSIKVADVIIKRFMALFPTGEVTPAAVLALPDETLRGIGMSWGKVKYVKDLAAKAEMKALAFDQFEEWDDEAIITELTQVKGIGRWTAEMFLMFTLARPDVFSKGDLGLRRGMQKLYNLEEDEWFKQVDSIVERWQPFRTYGAMAVWRSLDAKSGTP